ncbi:MAG: pilus assembly protein [Chloroflexota bacterium]|nr:pilus assembly protein [Chloroflexota bacterium]
MSRRAQGGRRGQGLVEFALVLPVFMLLTFGIIDGGRVVFANNSMAQGTRSIARVASTTCFQTTPACSDSSGPIATAIAAQASGGTIPTWTVKCINPATNVEPTNKAGDFCKVGYLVRVSVSSSFGFVTPVASSFGPITVSSSTEQEILQ